MSEHAGLKLVSSIYSLVCANHFAYKFTPQGTDELMDAAFGLMQAFEAVVSIQPVTPGTHFLADNDESDGGDSDLSEM